MLACLEALRKHSFGAGFDQPRGGGRILKALQVLPRGPREQGEGQRSGKLRICEQSAADGQREAPAGVPGD